MNRLRPLIEPRPSKIATLLVLGACAIACGSPPVQELEPPKAEPEQTKKPEEPPLEKEEKAPEEPPLPGTTPTPTCTDQTATFTPLRPKTNVLFALDRSGSMHTRLPSTGTRWTATRDALFGLIDKMPSLKMRASVMQFPQGDAALTCCSVATTECNCASYPAPTRRCSASTYSVSNPTDLDATKIANLKSQIRQSDDDFYWGTPLAASLTAAINAQKSSTNDGLKSVVLLTDGAPTSCETSTDPGANDIARVVEAAKIGMKGTEAVRTFVLGIQDGATGARADLLTQVAVAGGTSRYYAVDVANYTTTIASTLDRIAREATDCTFDLPPETATTDLSKFNVTLTRTGGPQTLVRDTKHLEGWDFVNGTKQFKLYGQSCRVLREEANAKVDIVIGCKTVPAPAP
jgi:hypothetical protein